MCAAASALHAVRCCEAAANVCFDSICNPTFIADGKQATLAEAELECSSRGKRLCTADELEAKVCWRGDRIEVPMPQHMLLAAVAERMQQRRARPFVGGQARHLCRELSVAFLE